MEGYVLLVYDSILLNILGHQCGYNERAISGLLVFTSETSEVSMFCWIRLVFIELFKNVVSMLVFFLS